MFAQLNENDVCITVSDYDTGIQAVIENLGQKRVFVSPTMDGETGETLEEGCWIWEELELSSAEKREQAYRNMTHKEDGTPLIEYRGVIYTCDQAFAQVKVYEEEDKYSGGTKAQELGDLWVAGKNYLRELYPEEAV